MGRTRFIGGESKLVKYLGETVKLKCKYKDENGTETDPTPSTAKVTLYDGQDNVVVSLSLGVKVGGTTGTYKYLYTTQTTDKAGTWHHKWVGTVGSFAVVEWKAFDVKEKI